MCRIPGHWPTGTEKNTLLPLWKGYKLYRTSGPPKRRGGGGKAKPCVWRGDRIRPFRDKNVTDRVTGIFHFWTPSSRENCRYRIHHRPFYVFNAKRFFRPHKNSRHERNADVKIRRGWCDRDTRINVVLRSSNGRTFSPPYCVTVTDQ